MLPMLTRNDGACLQCSPLEDSANRGKLPAEPRRNAAPSLDYNVNPTLSRPDNRGLAWRSLLLAIARNKRLTAASRLLDAAGITEIEQQIAILNLASLAAIAGGER